MSPVYLLDTSVLAEPLKINPDVDVLAALDRHGSDCAVPAPVWHELYFGMLRLPAGRKRTMIRTFLEETIAVNLPILPYDEQAAHLHGEFRAALEKKGHVPTFVDAQIAAIAISQQLKLVTRNIRDFRHIPGLRIECWHHVNGDDGHD